MRNTDHVNFRIVRKLARHLISTDNGEYFASRTDCMTAYDCVCGRLAASEATQSTRCSRVQRPKYSSHDYSRRLVMCLRWSAHSELLRMKSSTTTTIIVIATTHLRNFSPVINLPRIYWIDEPEMWYRVRPHAFDLMERFGTVAEHIFDGSCISPISFTRVSFSLCYRSCSVSPNSRDFFRLELASEQPAIMATSGDGQSETRRFHGLMTSRKNKNIRRCWLLSVKVCIVGNGISIRSLCFSRTMSKLYFIVGIDYCFHCDRRVTRSLSVNYMVTCGEQWYLFRHITWEIWAVIMFFVGISITTLVSGS